MSSPVVGEAWGWATVSWPGAAGVISGRYVCSHSITPGTGYVVCTIDPALSGVAGFGDLAFAEGCLDLGFYLGVDGPLTYPSAKTLREVMAQVPLDRIVLETDSPY